jgi:hypothetical protein
VSPRPLVFVSGLTFCDYLLWNWSLNHNHDVLALVSGLTLPPLAVATVWLLLLGFARLLARLARGTAGGAARGRAHDAARAPAAEPTGAGARDGSAVAAEADTRSGKLAA